MSWKKYFTVPQYNNSPQSVKNKGDGESTGTSTKSSSYLPEVYAGHPNRIQRYFQFDDMDKDSDINAALDTIADFCTQSEEQSDEPFEIKYEDGVNETEVTLVKRYLNKWVKINDFRSRLWFMFRNTLKNGDTFFLRDPETYEWLWIDHLNVEMVRVDDESGKEPTEYFVRSFEYNKEAKYATKKADLGQFRTPFGTSTIQSTRPMLNSSAGSSSFAMAGAQRDPRQLRMAQGGNQLFVMDAKNVVHLSLSVQMDVNWPFGISILEPIFKTYKQKELLEDAIIIYRVQRAPERRVFYIDVGAMPPVKARAHLDQIKNEIHQRRIPGGQGGGGSVMDAAYSPLAINEDFFFANNAEGRGSKVETLAGGECLALDTKIELLDGRSLELSEIIDEFNNGKQLWVYSINPDTGEVVPGMINWAGVTRKDAKVMRLTFDNGESVTVTPDHKFPVIGRGTVEARDLNINDSFFSHQTRLEKIRSNKKSEYTQVFDHSKKEWVFVHRMVAEYLRDRLNNTVYKTNINKKTTVHHIDFNRFNNDPSNLTWMSFYDHREYHNDNVHWAREGLKKYLDNMTPEEYEAKCKYISERIKESIAKKTPEELEEFRRNATSNLQKGNASKRHLWLLENDLEWRENLVAKRSATMKDMFVREPERREQVSNRNEKLWGTGAFDKSVEGQTIKMNERCWELLEGMKASQFKKTAEMAVNSDEFMAEFRKSNENTKAANLDWNNFVLTERHLAAIITKNGKKISDYKVKTKTGLNANFNTNFDMLKSLVDHYNAGANSMEKMAVSLYNDPVYKKLVNELNPTRHHLVKDNFGCTRSPIMTILNNHGFSSWKHFAQEQKNINHRLINIEYLDETMDTGTITVDGAEIYHDYHNFALSIGVYTKNSLGEIGDLDYFNRKFARGMKIPASYLALTEENQGTYNDGKVGQAMIQEFRFNKYCLRLQALLAPKFDKEFKRYLKDCGVEVDPDLYEIRFNPPQNFSKYRQIEVDQAQVGVYQQVQENKKLSERFKFKRFLGLSEDELIENERLWAEENAAKLKKNTGSTSAESEANASLGDIGVRPPSDFGVPNPEGEGEIPPEGEAPPAEAPAGGGAGGPADAGGPPI